MDLKDSIDQENFQLKYNFNSKSNLKKCTDFMDTVMDSVSVMVIMVIILAAIMA